MLEFLQAQRAATDGVDGSSIMFTQLLFREIGNRPAQEDVILLAQGAIFQSRQWTDFDQLPNAMDFQTEVVRIDDLNSFDLKFSVG